MTPTSITIATDALGLPTIPDPKALYDQLMAEIEPELLSSAILGLKEKYATESKEQAKARMKRYRTAGKKFQVALKEYMQQMKAKSRDFTRAAAKSSEESSRLIEDSELLDLESAMEDASSLAA